VSVPATRNMWPMPARRERPVSIAIVNDYELVVVGLAALLAPFSDRVQVVELDSKLPVASADVDVVLYDTFGQVQGPSVDVESLVGPSDAKVVIFSWNLHPELVEASLAHGADGYVSKGVTAEELVTAIEDVHAGKRVVPDIHSSATPVDDRNYPGREAGLTGREAEIIALITQGLSNQEIAERSYLSINSVKTYIRTAYRKMGVTRRSQAVLWGIKNGMQPDVVRRVSTADFG
jgi:NarL family two-component system response regulator LiaR